MTTTTTTEQIKANIDAASRNAIAYRNLLKVAKDHNHEYEIERLTRDLNEAEADLDDQIQIAIEAGLTPEDFEAPPMHCTGYVSGDPAGCARCGERDDLHA